MGPDLPGGLLNFAGNQETEQELVLFKEAAADIVVEGLCDVSDEDFDSLLEVLRFL